LRTSAALWLGFAFGFDRATGFAFAFDFDFTGVTRRSLQQQQARVLQQRDHAVHEARAVRAVDDAVVDRDRQQHHVADHDLVVLHERPLGDLVDAQDRDFREVDDGRREQATDVAGVRDREGAAAQVVERELALPGAVASRSISRARSRIER
jgi:hypothetical protein